MHNNGITINIDNQKVLIEYSKSENHHVIGINNRPFEAIKNGTKKVEVRTNTEFSPFDYFSIKKDDEIEFINEETNEILLTKVIDVRKYASAKVLLETEGTRNVLSSGGNLEQGILSINRLSGYFESIPKNGLAGIEIKVLR